MVEGRGSKRLVVFLFYRRLQLMLLMLYTSSGLSYSDTLESRDGKGKYPVLGLWVSVYPVISSSDLKA